MENFEIVCVTIQHQITQNTFNEFFQRFLNLGNQFEFIPSLQYQLHGLQKSADPILLYIFCLNGKDVIQTFKRDVKFKAAILSHASLAEVWKKVERWNLVYCICWFEGQSLCSKDETKYKSFVKLFVACIPPSAIRSSICVVNVQDVYFKRVFEVVIEALHPYRVRTKLSNVIQFSQLCEVLNSMSAEQLKAVKSNTRHVLDNIRSEILSKKQLVEEGDGRHGGKLSCLNPLEFSSTEEIMNIMVKDNPEVDLSLLESSIKSMLEITCLKKQIAVWFTFLAFISSICFDISMTTRTLILALMLFAFRQRAKYEINLHNIISEYNSSISKLRTEIDLIYQLYNDLGLHKSDEKHICYRKTKHDNFDPFYNIRRGIIERVHRFVQKHFLIVLIATVISCSIYA